MKNHETTHSQINDDPFAQLENDPQFADAYEEFNNAAAEQEMPLRNDMETIRESATDRVTSAVESNVEAAVDPVAEIADSETTPSTVEAEDTTEETEAENTETEAETEVESETEDKVDEEKAGFTVRQLDSLSDKISSLADRIHEAGGAREFAKQILSRTGHAALETAQSEVASAESISTLSNETATDTEQSQKQPGVIRRTLQAIAEKASARWNARNNKAAAEESVVESDDSAKDAQPTTQKEAPATRPNYGSQQDFDNFVNGGGSHRRNTYVPENHPDRLEIVASLEEAREARLEARRKALKAALRKQARQQMFKNVTAMPGELARGAKERLSKSFLGKTGRLAAKFARNSAAYVKGAAKAVHQAGMAGVEARNAAETNPASAEPTAEDIQSVIDGAEKITKDAAAPSLETATPEKAE
jgi:hypothetical protein